ncbi:flavin-dependent oxidoreductase [Nonomuraea candida]|uniref:flavin-dependent oxidoreductase n=1 Tax=Nonomuraea candida TaxID=359159 RepID=UPI001FE1A171|nr:flavin-dependent oxidoreductase [Nonomuraea candida]
MVMIIGAGIGGLTAALSLHAAGIDCTIVEAVPELKPLGVGINLQPHAVRELEELGLGEELLRTGIPTSALSYATRRGDIVLTVPRGQAAGYRWPQLSIHRGNLQMLLLRAVTERLGADVVRTGLSFEGFGPRALEPAAPGPVTVRLRESATGRLVEDGADVVIGADGVHSAVRARLHPRGDELRWSGITMWRGITERDPLFDGATMVVAGTQYGTKIVAYPICPEARANGRAMVNWVTEVRTAPAGAPASEADWWRSGRLEDVRPYVSGWVLPFLDVPELIAMAGRILEYPMVDKAPLPRWGAGRVSLLGDAAHPMYPVGSNGGSQAILDARYLALALATEPDPVAGLARYEHERRRQTDGLVRSGHRFEVDDLVRLAEQRAPGGFTDVSEVLTAQELSEMTAAHRRVADMDVRALNERPSWSVPR